LDCEGDIVNKFKGIVVDATTIIKGMKSFISLFEYCKSHQLVQENEDFFDREFYDENDFDTLFVDLWTRKLRHMLSSYNNVSYIDDNMYGIKIKSINEEYDFTFSYSFDYEGAGSIFFSQVDELTLICFCNSILEAFKELTINAFSPDASLVGNSITFKVCRENCFEKIIEVIEKLSALNKSK